MLQALEIIMAFMRIVTIRRKPYGLFVFFLSILIVTQLGLQGINVARAGGIEIVIATLIGIGIALIASAILGPMPLNGRDAGEKKAVDQFSIEPFDHAPFEKFIKRIVS